MMPISGHGIRYVQRAEGCGKNARSFGAGKYHLSAIASQRAAGPGLVLSSVVLFGLYDIIKQSRCLNWYVRGSLDNQHISRLILNIWCAYYAISLHPRENSGSHIFFIKINLKVHVGAWGLRCGLDRGVLLKPRNPYPFQGWFGGFFLKQSPLYAI